ncbi:Uncharacterized protein BXIN_2727 [Babesia sp. Xinjiang]|uniref:Uncharacterized protein n=1 Tax=Babesia sp. Xinjiang TaxID=462227 RepID=UPI000A240A5F|nr:Uncharacterized protein BXIN_2727 [Babesia sp. Xinjiang]ORM41697.1 Uncharacterized protein BXIN_2727 [Babesia sp. Xinjiang]
MFSKDALLSSLLEECHDTLTRLRSASSLEAVLEKLDHLIEKLFTAKSRISCHFDRQLLIESSRVGCDFGIHEDRSVDNKKKLRLLCLNFIRTLADIGHKKGIVGHIIPRLFTVLRLEVTLLEAAQNGSCQLKSGSPPFPVALLEYVIGIVLYSDRCDGDFVDSIIRDYLVTTSDWVYHTYIALTNMLENLDTSELCIYKNPNVSVPVVFERFMLVVLSLPKPQLACHIKRARVADKINDDNIANSKVLEDSDSGSQLDYSDQSVYDDHESGYDSMTESESVEDAMEQKTQTYDSAKAYASLWQSILFSPLPLPECLLPAILNRMPSDILPYEKNPLIYSNWLMAHLNGKDSILSMLSLKSIFELILKYGFGELEERRNDVGGKQYFSTFYERIYVYISDDILESNFGTEFLKLLSVAVQSVKLPSQLMGMFIKKLVRTACFTTCVNSTTLLIIAINLLKLHSHTCLSLVHRDNVRDTKRKCDSISMENPPLSRNNGAPNGENELYIWEIPLLLNHFNERTATIAGTFYSDLKKKRGTLLKAEDIIGCDSREHLRQEITRTRREDGNAFRKTLQKTTLLATQIFA